MWTTREIAALRERYPHARNAELAQCFGCTVQALCSQARQLGLHKAGRKLTRRRAWSEAEMTMLRAKYADTPTAQLARELGRELAGVYNQARKMGLAKSEAYLQSPAACRLRRGDKVGEAGRFQKGVIPHNKGMRRPGWAPGRMRETQFKPGERSGCAAANWKPIGTILKDSDGYARIKVREGQKGEATGFGNCKIWKLLHRHTWEQHNGPIPPAHNVVFRDGNRDNCELANLELVTRAEMMRRNSFRTNYPPDVVEVIDLGARLTRAIRRRERAQEQNRRSA